MHNKKLEAARKTLAKTVEMEEKKERSMRRTHSSSERGGAYEARVNLEMDIDEPDAQVQEADAALPRARIESAAKRRKTNRGECDALARAYAELDQATEA